MRAVRGATRRRVCCAPTSTATRTRSPSWSAGTGTGSGRSRCAPSATARRPPTPLQDALLSAHRAAARFRGDSAVTTWLHRIVVNACLDRIRRRQAHPTVPLPDGRAATDDRPGGRRSRPRRSRPRHRAGRPGRRWPSCPPSSGPRWCWSTCRATRWPRWPRSSGWPRARSRAAAPGAGPGWRCCSATSAPESGRAHPPQAGNHRTRRPRHIGRNGATDDARPGGGVMSAQRGRPRPARRLRRRRARRHPDEADVAALVADDPALAPTRTIGWSPALDGGQRRPRRAAPRAAEPMPDDVAGAGSTPRLRRAIAAGCRAAEPRSCPAAGRTRRPGRAIGRRRSGRRRAGPRRSRSPPAWSRSPASASTSAGGGISAQPTAAAPATSADAGGSAEQAPAAAGPVRRRAWPPAATTTTGSAAPTADRRHARQQRRRRRRRRPAPARTARARPARPTRRPPAQLARLVDAGGAGRLPRGDRAASTAAVRSTVATVDYARFEGAPGAGGVLRRRRR